MAFGRRHIGYDFTNAVRFDISIIRLAERAVVNFTM